MPTMALPSIPRLGALSSSVLLGVGLVWFAACDAELESECVGGDGTCDHEQLSSATASSSSGVGGSGGSGGGTVCDIASCTTDQPSGLTGEFPCDIEPIIANNCRRCHSANPTLQKKGPFPLDSYAESQELYGAQTVWFLMRSAAVDSTFMPLDPPNLTPAEVAALDAWTCQCAPPRPAGDDCMGGSGGAGGGP
jgi:hypothetical protein